MKENLNCILFKFIYFFNEDFQFNSCRWFQTPTQKFDFGLFKFKSESEMVTVFYLVLCAYKNGAHLNFTMIFWQKKYFYISRLISQEFNHCKFIHHKSHFEPFLSYLPCIVCREYFSIILNIKQCALYLTKYGNFLYRNFLLPSLSNFSKWGYYSLREA